MVIWFCISNSESEGDFKARNKSHIFFNSEFWPTFCQLIGECVILLQGKRILLPTLIRNYYTGKRLRSVVQSAAWKQIKKSLSASRLLHKSTIKSRRNGQEAYRLIGAVFQLIFTDIVRSGSFGRISYTVVEFCERTFLVRYELIFRISQSMCNYWL